MQRREFLRTATAGGAAATAAAGGAAAQETTPTPTAPNGTADGGNATAGNGAAMGGGTETGGSSGPASGGTKEVVVGPGGNLVFDPETVYVSPGTTVKWVWESDNHNVVVESQPDGAGWEGQAPDQTYDTGHEYEHTFETKGEYSYFCQPHKSVGMVGTVVVNDTGAPPGGEGGSGEKEIHEMGVPIQAHYVGIVTVLAIVVTLLFTFFVLKYGESPHTSGAK